ncbi:MAG: hypothetical protein OES24_05695 [Acidimicrobiia bacterium]|nr:hypothetical protein [Acidimicrobiia bacterium]
MKAVRIITIVVMLVAASCRSSADEATLISSTDAASSSGETGSVSDESADPAIEQDEAVTSEPASVTGQDGAVGDSLGMLGDETDGTVGATDDPGSGTGVDSAATGLLARVSEATVEASTGRFEGRLAAEAAPGAEQGNSFELTMEGSYDLDAEAFDLSVDLSGLAGLVAGEASSAEAEMFASMFAEPVQVRSIGGIAWVRWGLLAGLFGAVTDDGDTAWIEAAADEAASMTGQFGVDSPRSAADLLQTLADMDATVVEVGRDTVRGAETTHYQISIDLEAAAAKLSPEEQAELPGGVDGQLPIDLWIGDDGLLRRLVVELDDLDALGGLASDADEIASLLIEFEIFDVGEPVAIEPPPADQVISTDDLGFSLYGGF